MCWNSRSLALMQMFGRARALPTVLRYLIDKIAHLHGFLLTMHVSFKPDWARNPESPHSSVRLITLPCENNIFVIFAIRKVWCIIWYARILGAIFFGTFLTVDRPESFMATSRCTLMLLKGMMNGC